MVPPLSGSRPKGFGKVTTFWNVYGTNGWWRSLRAWGPARWPPGKGEHVRTLYREGATRDFLCALRGQSVWVALHRDRAPAARAAAGGQGADEPLSAFARVGG